MKNVKSILFQLKLFGNGIVNFDSGDQKYIWNSQKSREFSNHDNVSFAKKNWYKEDGELSYKIKISSDCLRHEIFVNDFEFQSPNVVNNDVLFLTSIATPASIVRGYLFAAKDLTIKKTSALTITDAEQTNNAVSSLETFSRSGKKVTDENKADTSFFKKETVGEIHYSAQGGFDLKALQFLSLSEIFDRLAVNPDLFPVYKNLLKTKLPSFNSDPKYYQIAGSAIQIPEYGVLFSNEDVVTMVKETLKKMLLLNITKSKAFAKTSELKIKLVYDGVEDKLNDDSGWITIDSVESVDALNFQTEVFFVEEEKEKAEALLKEIKEVEAVIKQKNKEEKEAAKKEKKGKSEADAQAIGRTNRQGEKESKENED